MKQTRKKDTKLPRVSKAEYIFLTVLGLCLYKNADSVFCWCAGGGSRRPEARHVLLCIGGGLHGQG